LDNFKDVAINLTARCWRRHRTTKTVRLWDVGMGAVIWTLERYSGSVWTVAFSGVGIELNH